MATRCDGVATRKRIVDAAHSVFSERGFHGATNAEICRRSEVNGAAINYHFRTKEALYIEAFKSSMAESLERHPLDGGVSKAANPELRLKSMIRSTVSRICDPENRSFRILRQEMTEPTGLIDGVMSQFLNEERAIFRELVGAFLGSGVKERTKELCTESVMSQCLHPALQKRRAMEKGAHCKRGHEKEAVFNVEECAQHAFEFSIAALREFSRRG